MSSGDDYKKNVKVLTAILDDTTKRIFSSVSDCPMYVLSVCFLNISEIKSMIVLYRGIRRILSLVFQLASQKFESESPKVKYTAVAGFIFLRFFVPALLVSTR